MNNKHLACAFLGMVIAAMAYGTMMFHNKVTVAAEEEEVSERAYEGAVQARGAQQQGLAYIEKSTKGMREYLKEWEPHLRRVENARYGESLINLQIKSGNMVTLSSIFEPKVFNKGGTIPNRLQGRIDFEDDYVKTLNWLAGLEGELPASRISSCRLSKGQSGNDIKMELTMELPILNENGNTKA